MPATIAVEGKIRIVIPVHNRREISLRCLGHLRELGVMDWAGVIVVDDGSTDGTSEAVAAEFPEVERLHGDGNLWWGGAIRMGMERAIAGEADFIFWLNDDCFPRAGTLETLLDISSGRRAVVTAQTLTERGVQFGGHVRTWRGTRKVNCGSGDILACEGTSGNCVCIPRAVVDAIGPMAGNPIRHQWADLDYGFLARRKGFSCLVSGDALCDDARIYGYREISPEYGSWLLSDRPISEVWKDLRNEKSQLYLPARLTFFRRHWGLWGHWLGWNLVLWLGVITAVRMVCPLGVLRRLAGRFSHRWQAESLQKAAQT